VRFEEPTRWELFLDGFRNFWNCLDCYNDGDDWGYDDFWEALSYGWMQIYIWDYDDPFNRTISPERKLRIDQRPPVLYVSEEAYDKLIEAINKPPEYNEKIARVLSRKAPWDEEND